MRRALCLFGCTLGLLCAGVAAAQGVPETTYAVEVVSAEAVVRCGPSDKFYPTNRLRPGERLQVLGSEPSQQYLRIAPPKGSFSWIEARLVRQMYPNIPNYVVSDPGTDAPVYTGSAFEEQSKHHPNHESCKLKWGTQVRAVGAPHTDDAGTWLPIEPPPAEARYVPAAAVKRLAEAVATRPASPPASPEVRPTPAAAPAVVPAASVTPSALAPLDPPPVRSGAVMRTASPCPPPGSPCDPAYTPPGRVYPTPAEPPPSAPNVRLNPPFPANQFERGALVPTP